VKDAGIVKEERKEAACRLGLRNFFSKILRSIHPSHHWRRSNGYYQVLSLCLPMMTSNISISAMLFTNRIFLSHYSLDAIAASLPAGTVLMTITSFFYGLISYVSIFTAQYKGAGRPRRATASMWQGLYLALISGFLIALTYFLAPLIFDFGAHPPEVQKLEIIYYRILAVPSVLNFGCLAMASFLAGLGRTKVVMWVQLAGALINIPLTYILVFGLKVSGVRLFQGNGIVGAAWATVASWLVIIFIFALIIFNHRMENNHGVFSTRKFDFKLLRRLIIYGAPEGLQRFLDLAAFTFFVFIVGRLGELYLAINNIIFSIESLSFSPLIGLGTSISILVGQSIGAGRPDQASKAYLSGVGISTFYILIISAIFLIFPRPLLGIFLSTNYISEDSGRIIELGVILLRFVVTYTLFDGLYICSFGALSGAGDVMFPMVVMGISGFLALAFPVWVLFKTGVATIYTLWVVFVFYVLTLNIAGTWRYCQGRWRDKKVI
jgi:MATE family multidrug resistance protein